MRLSLNFLYFFQCKQWYHVTDLFRVLFILRKTFLIGKKAILLWIISFEGKHKTTFLEYVIIVMLYVFFPFRKAYNVVYRYAL